MRKLKIKKTHCEGREVEARGIKMEDDDDEGEK